MAVRGFFYNSVNKDRLYDGQDMNEDKAPFYKEGVVFGHLQVTAEGSNMTVKVDGGKKTGYAYINMHTIHNTTVLELQLRGSNGVHARIDRVVLRNDETERKPSIYILEGTSSANPQPAELINNDVIQEKCLAEIYIAAGAVAITQADITDTRADTKLCGFVASQFKEFDFSQLTAQFNAWFALKKGNFEKDYADFIQEYSELIESFTTEQADEWNKWFNDKKEKLSADVAVRLQTDIGNIQKRLDNNTDNFAKKIELEAKADYAWIENGDFNNMTTPGVYTMEDCAHYPEWSYGNEGDTDEANYSGMIVLNSDENYIEQLAVAEGSGTVLTRYKSGSNAWSAWKRLAFASEVDELKKSVSDGKAKVAAAVTAKGVNTATNAAFQTIATNIAAIKTGTDTSDATAIAANILMNKTAYVNGKKVTGTMWDYSNNTLKVTPSSTQTGKSEFSINPGYHMKIMVDSSNVYNAGITYADGRANANSTNYKSGYNAGYSAGEAAGYKFKRLSAQEQILIYNNGTVTKTYTVSDANTIYFAGFARVSGTDENGDNTTITTNISYSGKTVTLSVSSSSGWGGYVIVSDIYVVYK